MQTTCCPVHVCFGKRLATCRYPGHPDSVEKLVRFDDDTVLSGGGDGVVRALSVLPNSLLAVLGSHGEEQSVQDMALSHDQRLLATVAHDDSVQLWDLAMLHDSDVEDTAAAGAIVLSL